MSTYKVKSNLKHDGKEFAKGDTIELEGEQAKQLLQDGIIVDPNAEGGEGEGEAESPQPPVNTADREGENVEGEREIKPGTTEPPQPGEGQDEAPKSQYKVLQGLEHPKGTAHEVDAILELTDEEASEFAEGLIEKVEAEDNL